MLSIFEFVKSSFGIQKFGSGTKLQVEIKHGQINFVLVTKLKVKVISFIHVPIAYIGLGVSGNKYMMLESINEIEK